MPERMTDPPAQPAELRRFRMLFGREPTLKELRAFRVAHDRLALRLPARVRREAARVITRF